MPLSCWALAALACLALAAWFDPETTQQRHNREHPAATFESVAAPLR